MGKKYDNEERLISNSDFISKWKKATLIMNMGMFNESDKRDASNVNLSEMKVTIISGNWDMLKTEGVLLGDGI